MHGATTASPPPPPWVSEEVCKFVSLLKRQWLLYDLFEEPPTTCWPFLIPKTSEKVSLITSYANQNGLEGCTPPRRFLLRSWEHLRELLVTLHAGVPLYAMHIDLMNAFWSSGLVESARTFFRLCPGPNRRVVGLGRLPFGGSIVPSYACRCLRGWWSTPCPLIFCSYITWMIVYSCIMTRGTSGVIREALLMPWRGGRLL